MSLWFFNYDNVNVNKDFGGANHVHVPYCSGDLHSGTVTSPSDDTWGLYFSGHLVFEAVVRHHSSLILALSLTSYDWQVDELIAKYNLGSATDVILSGDSAGGIGVWMNLDYLKDRLTKLNPTARVVGAPIAGFYFYANDPYTGPDHTSSTLANFSESGMATAYNLWQSYVDQTCLDAKEKNSPADPHACTLAAYAYPYIDADTFIIEAQTDQVVLEAHDWVPSPPKLCDNSELQYVASWRDEMLRHLTENNILDLTSSKSGAFVPACYTHTGFSSSSPLITPTTSSTSLQFYEAFGNWYYNRTDASSYKLYDVCKEISDVNSIDAKANIFCNPSCTSPC